MEIPGRGINLAHNFPHNVVGFLVLPERVIELVLAGVLAGRSLLLIYRTSD